MARNVLRLAGLGVIMLGLAILAAIPYFYWRSHVVSSRLLQTANKSFGEPQSSPATSKPVNTTQTLATVDGVIGKLQIPRLGLTAPVVNGTDDVNLNAAVGHLRTSVMPGAVGTSLLAAHNATWFRHIDQLRQGDEIDITTRDGRYVFTVTKKQIVHVGTAIPNTAGPSLVLESCYPLDALYLTPYRYIVSAALKSAPTGARVDVKSLLFASGSRYSLGIPERIRDEGITLATNSLPMGTLTYDGRPSDGYVQSNEPLNASSSVVELYLALVHALADKDQAAVAQIFPGLQGKSMALWGVPAASLRYAQGFDIQLDVQGTQLLRATAVTRLSTGRSVYTVRLTVSPAGLLLRLIEFSVSEVK